MEYEMFDLRKMDDENEFIRFYFMSEQSGRKILVCIWCFAYNGCSFKMCIELKHNDGKSDLNVIINERGQVNNFGVEILFD